MKNRVFGPWPQFTDAMLRKRPNYKPQYAPFRPGYTPYLAKKVWDEMSETAPVMVGVSL